MNTTIRLNTIGRLAEKLHQPVSRIAYVIRTRPHIQHVAVAGRTRLFDEQAVAQVRHELNAIDARQASEGAAL